MSYTRGRFSRELSGFLGCRRGQSEVRIVATTAVPADRRRLHSMVPSLSFSNRERPIMSSNRLERGQVRSAVEAALGGQPVVDMHTHTYPATFGTPVSNATGKTDPAGLMLWGIDELVTYHYLIAEVYRVVPPSRLPYEHFWAMSKSEQADHIWKHLFLERTPI